MIFSNLCRELVVILNMFVRTRFSQKVFQTRKTPTIPVQLRLSKYFVLSALVFFSIPKLMDGKINDVKHRFLTEAPIAWKKHEDYVKRWQGRSEIYIEIHKDKSIREGFCENKQNDNCQLSLYQPTKNTAGKKDLRDTMAGKLEVYNSKYYFSLYRSKIERPWVLRNFEIFKPSARDEHIQITGEMDRKMSPLYRLVILSSTKLRDLVKQPTFRVVGAKAVQYKSRDCVEI